MPRDRAAQFEVKKGLVKLFKAQCTLLREIDPDGIGKHIAASDINRYDALIARGPNVRWPAGILPGLREGIRDAQFMLKSHFGPAKDYELVKRLRAAAESTIANLEAPDAKKLAAIVRLGRTRSEAEYHLVRSEIDRLEGDSSADREYLERLWVIADRAAAK
jgi:hypothetical protein